MTKNEVIASLLLEAANLLKENQESQNESILDPVNFVRCQEIFDENDKMKVDVVKFIRNTFILWFKQLNQDLKIFKIKGFKAIGSSTGFQYTDSSDLDIQVYVEMIDGHDFKETRQLVRILPNGNNVPNTNHPVNYFLVDENDPTDLNKVENLYNLDTEEWEKKTDLNGVEVPVLYVREISRFFTDGFDLLMGRYDRDKQYLLDALKLNPEIQSISENEKQDAIDKNITQLKADIDSMRLAEKLIHGFRLESYDDNNFFHVSINYMDDNDPRKSMNEAIYKSLDKFEYRAKLKAKINEGYELIDKIEKIK